MSMASFHHGGDPGKSDSRGAFGKKPHLTPSDA
jgi:hypothetical protein